MQSPKASSNRDTLFAYSRRNIQLCQLVSLIDFRIIALARDAFSKIKGIHLKAQSVKRSKKQATTILRGVVVLSTF